MRKTIIALGLAAVMLLGVTYAYSQGPSAGPRLGEKPRWGSGEPGKFLSLTPEQKTKLSDLRLKFRGESAQLIGAMVTRRIELQSLWSNPTADAQVILDKEKELRDLQNQMRDKAVQMKLEARKFLTPEQIAGFGPGCGMSPGFGRGNMMGSGKGMGMGHGPGMWQ